jgi:CheY-like chemotaxis protein
MSGQKTVLIADDDASLVEALALRCRSLGLTTRCSTDGLHAIMNVLQAPPDLAILDVAMPATDGLSVCEKLMSNRFLEPIPVIMLTGRRDLETMLRCQRLGAHYVVKGADAWERLRPLVCQLLNLAAPDTGVDEPEPAAQAAGGRASQRHTAPSAGPTQPAESKRRALVVDDDPDIVRALEMRLTAAGLTVAHATSGMQAYWMALRQAPDVILSDYVMPDGAGDYLIRRLKEHPLTTDVPIIVMTGKQSVGRPDFSVKRTMMNLGVTAFFTKPLDMPALVREVQRCVEGEPTPCGA